MAMYMQDARGSAYQMTLNYWQGAMEDSSSDRTVERRFLRHFLQLIIAFQQIKKIRYDTILSEIKI